MTKTRAVAVQNTLNSRFTYKGDKGERWKILASEGPVSGDCEDYSLTLIYNLERGSMFRFWWALTTSKYVPWFCLTPNGVGHVVMWCRGLGWTDNIQQEFVTKAVLSEKGYKLRYPFLPPLVAFKFATRNLTGSNK